MIFLLFLFFNFRTTIRINGFIINVVLIWGLHLLRFIYVFGHEQGFQTFIQFLKLYVVNTTLNSCAKHVLREPTLWEQLYSL